jgi:aryl-alcohol dehydrogenase-like predicted oxidoreductase
MRYRQLGASGLRISVLSMGTMYPYWHQAKAAADRLGRAELALRGPYPAG